MKVEILERSKEVLTVRLCGDIYTEHAHLLCNDLPDIYGNWSRRISFDL